MPLSIPLQVLPHGEGLELPAYATEHAAGMDLRAALTEPLTLKPLERALVPVFEREGVTLNMEPHPEDWCETLHPAIDMIRMIGSKNVRFLYCAPHTFYFGDDMGAMIREAGDLIAHVHVADTYNHKGSSGLRYIVNPPGARVTVHQHMDMHQGEIDWDVFFSSLASVGFDGIMTACVFAWEERAEDSSRFMRTEMQKYVDEYWK